MAQPRCMNCHACDRELSLPPGERVGFREECSGCGADLHVCRNCAHHEPSSYNECRESNAEWVSDRERANRCDYYSPGDQQGGAAAEQTSSAQDALANLFKK